jgi:hypothetical protein
MRKKHAKKWGVKEEYRSFFLPRMLHLKPNITYRCDRGCPNCNRATRLCPSRKTEDLDPKLFADLLSESLKMNRPWNHITLTGGEPTMHDAFEEFVKILVDYKKEYPRCIIDSYTYHHPKHYEKAERVMSKYPEFIIKDTGKETARPQRWAVHKAPMDDPKFSQDHSYKGCNMGARLCGLGWDASGFYCCPIAAAIARVFNLQHIGVKSLKDLNANLLIEQYPMVCSRCGFYVCYRAGKSGKDILSPTWEKAVSDYKERYRCVKCKKQKS